MFKRKINILVFIGVGLIAAFGKLSAQSSDDAFALSSDHLFFSKGALESKMDEELIFDYKFGVDIPYYSSDFSFDKKLFKAVLNQHITDVTEESDQKHTGLLPDVRLGKDSRIIITGRKSVKMAYTYRYFPDVNRDNTNSSSFQKFDSKFDIKQEMQVKVEGQIKNRIFINVDYDDTLEEKNRQNITVLYKGTDDEILQTAEVGNINLSLPNTEFISFSKKLFGIRTYSKFGPFKHYMILSKEEGETSSATYTGTKQEFERDITDLDFAKNFFSIDLGKHLITTLPPATSIAFPIKDVRIVVDNLNPSDNQGITPIVVGDIFYYFKDLTRESDFFIDNTTGIIELRNMDWVNGLLAIEFVDAFGVKHGLLSNGVVPLFLWDANLKTSAFQMKNKYILGIQNIDLSNLQVSILRENKDSSIILDNKEYDFMKIFNLSTGVSDQIDPTVIDTVAGIITFPLNLPFDLTLYDSELLPVLQGNALRKEQLSNKTVYEISGQKTKYKLRIKYNAPITEYRLNAFDIIENSERVIVDGKTLVKNTHYRIDYLAGIVTILDPSQINVNSNVQITFEYHPFFAAQTKTLFGTRLEYDLNDADWLKVGATYISEAAPEDKDKEIPRFGEEPFTNTVYGVNALATLDDSMIKGLKLKLRTELARSELNPNTAGKVFVDDMEGSELIRSIAMSRSSWFVASLPSNETYNPADRYELINVDTPETNDAIKCFFINDTVANDTIRPNFGTSTRQALILRSLPTNPVQFFSFGQRISRLGEDFEKYKYVEIWYKVDASLDGKILNIQLGDIAEDSDGDGLWDTEDLEIDGIKDGQVTTEEDVGYDFNIPGKDVIKYGARNNRIDDEDIGGDGTVLTKTDPPGMQKTYSLELNYTSENNGWVIVKVPLEDFIGSSMAMQSVRYLRMYGRGFSGGSMQIAKIDFVGTVWEAEESTVTPGNTFFVSTIDNISSPDFVPLHSEIDKDTKAIKKDVAIELKFEMDHDYLVNEHRQGFSTKDYGTARDFTKYKTYRVYYYPKQHPITAPYALNPYLFVVRLMTTSNDYYEFSQIIEPDSTGWRYIDVPIQNTTSGTIGNPSMQSIYKMQVGVMSYADQPYRGVIYVNDMMLVDADTLIGNAGSFEISSSFKDYGSVSYTLNNREGTYSLIGEMPKNIDIRSESLSVRFDPGRLLFGSKVTTSTSLTLGNSTTTNNNDIISSINNAGENVNERLSFNTTLNVQGYPVISYAYNISRNENSMIIDPSTNVIMTQNVRLDYAVPVYKISFMTLTPSRISLGFGEQRNKTTFSIAENNNLHNRINDWNADIAWPLITNLQLSGRYALREQWDEIRNLYAVQNETTALSGTYSNEVNKYVSVRSNYATNVTSNWDLRTAEALNTYYLYRVNGARTYSGGLSFRLIELAKKLPLFTRSFDFSIDYSNSLRHEYDKISQKPDFSFYLGVFDNFQNEISPKTVTTNDRYSLAQSTVFFDKISTRLQYAYTISDTLSPGGQSIGETREWPSGSIGISDFNGVPFIEKLQKIVSSQSINISYRETVSFTKSSTDLTVLTTTPSLSWNITWLNGLRTDITYSQTFSERKQIRYKTIIEERVQASFHADYTIALKKKLTAFLSDAEREVNTTIKLSGDFRYSSNDSDTSILSNFTRYETILNGAYNFSDEMRLTAGLFFTKNKTRIVTTSFNEYRLEVGFEVLF